MAAYAGGMSLTGWSRVYAGKVHDMYIPIDQQWHAGSETMLIVASDRISVNDRVVPSIIPDKGELQTKLTLWWFQKLADIVDTHIAQVPVPEKVRGRGMIVRRLRMYPMECVVAGYMTDLLLPEYQKTGELGGVKLPAGLVEGDKLPEPIFLPARKGAVDADDIDISYDEFAYIVGLSMAENIRAISKKVYQRGHEICAQAGIVLANCKLEFGTPADVGDETVVLGDEVLTPDSATMWLASDYRPGQSQVAMGKQFVRKWLANSGWDRDKGTPPPPLPSHVIHATQRRYQTVVEKLLVLDSKEAR